MLSLISDKIADYRCHKIPILISCQVIIYWNVWIDFLSLYLLLTQNDDDYCSKSKYVDRYEKENTRSEIKRVFISFWIIKIFLLYLRSWGEWKTRWEDDNFHLLFKLKLNKRKLCVKCGCWFLTRFLLKRNLAKNCLKF